MLPYFNLNHASTVQYMAERDGDQSHTPPPFTLASDASRPILFNNLQDQSDTGHFHIQQYPLKHQTTVQFLISGTSGRLVSKASMDDEEDNIGVDNLKLSLCDHYVKEDLVHVPSSSKRMPSKMSIMRKTMNNVSDRGDVADGARPIAMHLPLDRSGQHRSLQVSGRSNDNNSPWDTIRVCSDCGTTKTPLWRSGPCGPKSLCNACGIRQRKARRAIAAAAANGGLLPPRHGPVSAKVRKLDQKKLDVAADRAVPFKKRCKLLGAAAAGTTAQAKLCLEDVTLSLGTSSTFERVFPQDERDAAVLLMAMSCGII